MAPLPADLLVRPAAQSVRHVAQGFLDAALSAAQRLSDAEDTEDPEALHDFRVALRRLRTTLRAYRPELKDGISGKLQRRLRAVATATNRAREAEVALSWLRPLEARLEPRERVGWRWLVARIERRHAKGVQRAATGGWRAFAAVEQKLREGLSMRPAPTARPFGHVVQAALLQQATRLDELLPAIQGAKDPEAHRARIAAKRLRYLLEALVAVVPGAAALIRRLKTLQDGLGELHDVLELEGEVRAAVESVAAKRAVRSGLVALARRLRARRTATFAELRATWLGRKWNWSREIEAVLRRRSTRSTSHC